MSTHREVTVSRAQFAPCEIVRSALERVTWRAVIVTQLVGLLFSLSAWLERWPHSDGAHLLYGVLGEALIAVLVMFAALACDELVRRGAPVGRSFVAVLLSASLLNVVAQWLLNGVFGFVNMRDLPTTVNEFFTVGGLWGAPVMVYVNRQSARRLLDRIRVGELDRAQTERRLVASRLAAARAELDPVTILRQLAETRDLFASGQPDADRRLEELIAGLRERVSVVSAAPAGDPLQ